MIYSITFFWMNAGDLSCSKPAKRHYFPKLLHKVFWALDCKYGLPGFSTLCVTIYLFRSLKYAE